MRMNFKEDLAKYMVSGSLHLSKKDFGFFNNVKSQINQNKPITSNQDLLFNKLLLKYKRQLLKEGYKTEDLLSLVWKISVIKSEPEYLRANVLLQNNKIIIKTPFNTKFISSIRDIKLQPYIWNKKEKCYEADLSTYNLKKGLQCVKKYYDDISFDSQICKIINTLNQYSDVKFWDPTLVKVGDNYYISCLNESLYEAIKNIEWSNNPKFILKLSQYGITIDESVIHNDALLNFASNYYATVDIDNIKELRIWLDALEYDLIFLGSNIIFNKPITDDLKKELGDIPISRNTDDLDLYKNILYLNYNSYKRFNSSYLSLNVKDLHKNISKVLTITNSRPVYVK